MTRIGSVPDGSSVLSAIGKTPTVALRRILETDTSCKQPAKILAKLEYLNPSGSVKDRMVAFSIHEAERRGELKPKSIIVEATSGNTGVALAMVAASKGHHAIIVMPETTSAEKVKMIESFGAHIVLTPERKGMAGTVEIARKIAKRKGAFLLDQFENQDNWRSHQSTGEEILEASGGTVDAFVASIGTGGTLIGVARVLKKENPETRIIAVEPAKVPSFYNLFYGEMFNVASGMPHKIEGIGEGFVPKILEQNRHFVDEVMLVKDCDAEEWRRRLAVREGIFAGPSSGANVWAAVLLAKGMGEKKTVVTVVPDSGMKYLSRTI